MIRNQKKMLLMFLALLSISGCRQQVSSETEPSTSSMSTETISTAKESSETSLESVSQSEQEKTPSTFTACSLQTTSLGQMKYWLYTPANATENMPLIVYLHGGSGKGNDLELITSADGFPKYLKEGQLGDVPSYVVIPQLPSTQKGWSNGAAAVYELIKVTISKFKINEKNISLTGHSMGGTGTWSLALSYSTLFKKIAPLSGSIQLADDSVEKLKNLPVWAFVGSADTIVPPSSSMEFIDALKEAGGDAKITIFDGADHFSVPPLTYLDEEIDLVDWLID